MLEPKLSVPPDASKLELVYYPSTTEELRDKLWPLKLSYGDFQYVLKDHYIYSTLQVIVAHGPLGGIHAWVGVYKRGEINYIGVFVEEAYRHQGLGGRLKQQALQLCKAQGRDCVWQDRKDNDKWVQVKASDNAEERFDYEKYGE